VTPYLVATTVTPYLVATDVTPYLVATESSVRPLLWLDSWLSAPELSDVCDAWRAPGSRFGGRDVGAADTGISGEKFLTGRLSPLADGGDGIDVVETRTAARSITANLPTGSTLVVDGPPYSQFLVDGGYVPEGGMSRVPSFDWAWHPSCYVFDSSTATFTFYSGITGSIILRYRVRFATAFVLQFGTEQAVPSGEDSMTAVDAHAWTITGARYWTLTGTYLGLATVRNFGGAQWLLDAPDASALGIAAGAWLVLRLVATPPGQAAIPLYFLLSAPRSA